MVETKGCTDSITSRSSKSVTSIALEFDTSGLAFFKVVVRIYVCACVHALCVRACVCVSLYVVCGVCVCVCVCVCDRK